MDPPATTMSTILRVLLGFGSIFVAASSANAAAPDSCNANVNIPRLKFSASSLACEQVWSDYNYNLRYTFNKSSNTLSVLLSASQINNWIAIGFSPNGGMVGSSAVLGYLELNGTGIIRQYYLKGKTSDLVIPDQGDLKLVQNTELVAVQNQTTYLAFQVHISNSLATSSKLVLAFGYPGILPDPETNKLEVHRDQRQITFDFVKGVAKTAPNTDKLKRNHGIINIFGWAVLAPIGAVIARYFRQWDPAWFYLHLGFQTLSFVFATTGVALGVRLTQKLPSVSVHNHRTLGIFVLALGILQVLALCLRPNKEAKIRKFWNWYHHIVGRLVLLLAAINIVVGINLAGAGHSWKVGYALILVITFITVIILEFVHWYKRYKRPAVLVPSRTAFSTFDDM